MRPSRAASAAVSSGTRETSAVTSPGSIVEPGRVVDERRIGGRLRGRGSPGSPTTRSTFEHVEHPPRADERARHLVHRLGRGPQRDDEERRVAVERDEVADVDLPREHEVRADPRDEHDEDPREEHLRRVERRLRRRDMDPGPPDALGLSPVAVVERLLAADAAQHAQAGGGVGAERGELPDLLALRALTRLERTDDAGEREHEDADADQHDEPEHDRAGQEDRRDDDVRDDGAGEPRGDVEGAARAERVVRHRGDHLARRQPTAHGRPRARRVVTHDLDERNEAISQFCTAKR